jgi:hypothetical protein
MKHVRVLLVAVALVAMILAILPDVANAAADLDGKVDAALNGDGGDTNKGDGGGDTNKSDGGADLEGKADGDLRGDGGTGDGGSNLGDTADRVLNSDTTADSVTDADQQVNLNDQPQVDGDTFSNTELNNPAVPASGEAKADGNGELNGPVGVNEGVCVSGAVNGSAGDCGDASGSLGDTVATPDINANLGDTTVDSDTTIDQQVNDDPLQQDGTLDNRNDIVAPTVPASGTANLDGNVTEGDLLNQDVSSCTDLNAAGCSGDTIASPDSGASIDLGDPFGGLDGTDVNSETVSDQQVAGDPLRQDGTLDNTNDVIAPAVPASGTTELNGNVGVGDTLNQDVSSCTDLNAAGCGDDPAPVPDTGNSAGIDLGESFADLGDTTASSNTTIGQQANDDPLQSNGNTIGHADVVAPAVPASATAELNGIVAEGDTLNQDASFCGTLNAAGCGGDAAASPDSGAGIDLGDPVANLGANAVPEGGATLGADTALSGDAATPAGSDDLSGDARATLSGDAALSSDAEPISSSSDAAFSRDAVLSGDVDTAPASDDAMTTISDSAALNSGAGSAPAGDDTTLGVDAALNSDAGATLSSDTGTPADSSATPSGDARMALSGDAESVPAGSDTVPAGDDSPIILSNEVATPFTGSSDATLANGDSGTSINSDAGTVPAGRNDESPGKLALANTTTDTAAGPSGEPASTADPSDNRTQNLAAGPSKSRFRTLAGSPFSDWSVALAAGPFVGEGKASASSGSATKSGDRLLDTGGVSSLVLIAALLFIGSGILLVTKRRRFNS